MAFGHDQGKAHQGSSATSCRRRSPASSFEFSQNIEDNVEEAASGVKGQNSVKLYGERSRRGRKGGVSDQGDHGRGLPGSPICAVFDALGQPTINIKIDRDKAAHYGLSPGDVNAVVQAAIGGQAAGNLYEYGIRPQFPDRHPPCAAISRQNIDAIRRHPGRS